MGKQSLNSVLFNAAGIGLLVTTVGYMGYSFVVTPKIPRCSERYPAGTQFSFTSETGKPLTPIELQGRGGAKEWGVLQNAKIVAKGASAPAAVPEKFLNVTLAKTGNEEQVDQNGIGFIWPVEDLQKYSAACLSYKVKFPKEFKFTEAGYLPGVYGIGPEGKEADENGPAKPAEGFQVRMGWGAADGDVGVEIRSPESAGTWVVSDRKNQWPLGEWVDVEQELVLDDPAASNGYIRVWINGKLTVEMYTAYLRGTANSVLAGVLSEIGYARTASEAQTIRVSPFIVSWQ